MLTEQNLKNNKNRIINIIILTIVVILFYILFVIKIEIPCMFKSVLGISCPGCGMTRAIDSIFHLELLNALKYNILAIPLFLCGIISFFYIIIDIIKNKDSFIKFLNKMFAKYWWSIIIILIIMTIINNINKI